MMGKAKDEIPPTGTYIWVDVRDLALCHVLAMEKEAAANKRFFITTGYFSNKEIAEIIGKNFPQYKEGLPSASTPGGGYPDEGVYKIDNSNVVNTLGVKFRPLEESIVDTVKSLQAVGA
ncbi:hypothetical protein KC346_g3868 [Hortaea werneckii]|nr:hypothetical protein KC346_g3868 [Hortaea werneckii]